MVSAMSSAKNTRIVDTMTACHVATRQPTRKPSASERHAAGGTTSAMSEARTADQYALERTGALVWKTQAAPSSLGTKNDARSPIVPQYARRRGIHSTAVRGCISDAMPLAL